MPSPRFSLSKRRKDLIVKLLALSFFALPDLFALEMIGLEILKKYLVHRVASATLNELGESKGSSITPPLLIRAGTRVGSL